ncbi:PadR family transcriptional regulator [Candidatus Bathyarchaeota archaeon]|nr:PadR family transcriptional regulator [Candidatus Bathyarchaeota archaeon]
MAKIGDVFLRSLEKPIILWLLARKPRYGYELIVEFKRLTGRKLKPSMVYPFLHRLEEKGFASAHWVTKGKRRIKHYSLTKNGEDLLKKVKSIFAKHVKEVLVNLIEGGKEKHGTESS